MKKFPLIAVVFAGMFFVMAPAEARHPERVVRYYDHCGAPVYGYVYHRSRSYRPYYRSYYRPAPVYYVPRHYGYRPSRHYRAPRVGFSFHFRR